MKKTFVFVLLTIISYSSYAQSEKTNKEFRYSNKFSIGTDLAQPFLLGGFNINVTYMTNRWVFDYSHGMSLEIRDFLQTDVQKALDTKIELPWTTGPGIGYRFTQNLDARLDFKAHRNEIELLNGQQELEYTQFTIGPGVFYRLYLGKKTGFGLEASARYWFDFGNNLENLNGDEFNFTDNEGNSRKFNTDISSGIGVNIALIYTFGRNK
jgi:hypothetical protein